MCFKPVQVMTDRYEFQKRFYKILRRFEDGTLHSPYGNWCGEGYHKRCLPYTQGKVTEAVGEPLVDDNGEYGTGLLHVYPCVGQLPQTGIDSPYDVSTLEVWEVEVERGDVVAAGYIPEGTDNQGAVSVGVRRLQPLFMVSRMKVGKSSDASGGYDVVSYH